MRFFLFIFYCGITGNESNIIDSIVSDLVSFVVALVLLMIILGMAGRPIEHYIVLSIFWFILCSISWTFAFIRSAIIAVDQSVNAREFLLEYGVLLTYNSPAEILYFIRSVKTANVTTDFYATSPTGLKLYKRYMSIYE